MLPLVRYAETTPLFTLNDLRDRYGGQSSDRTIRNMLYRLKREGRVLAISTGIYRGRLSALPLDRHEVPAKLRSDAVLAFHSALEFHGNANQVFQTVYYLSARPGRDVVYAGITYHCVAPPKQLVRAGKQEVEVKTSPSGVRVTTRERSLVDCLLYLDYSGGVEELDKCLAMFPSFGFEAALDYLRLLKSPWLYARLGFLLDRQADKLYFKEKWRDLFLKHVPKSVVYLGRKRPGYRWVPTWSLMVPPSLVLESVHNVRA